MFSTSPLRPLGGFEAKPDIGADEGAVTHEHVVDGATAHFAAHHKAAVRMVYDAVVDDHVFGGIPFRPPSSLPFDADAVVAGIKMTIFHECAFLLLSGRAHRCFACTRIFTEDFNRYVFAELDMGGPGR